MAIYKVKNQWGGSAVPWLEGGTFVLGCRENQNVVALEISSGDGGKTLVGRMTYEGESPIGFRAIQIVGNNYAVENQWGGVTAPWHPGGNWIIGARKRQNVIALNLKAEGNSLEGSMSYQGEGPINIVATLTKGSSYSVDSHWGGESAPWHSAGTFVLGNRENQHPVAFDLTSYDSGRTLEGTMTYEGEASIGFRATQILDNNYNVENQLGGPTSRWVSGGQFVIGSRVDQRVISLKISSSNEGTDFTGQMTYFGESAIDVKAVLSTNSNLVNKT